LKASIVYDNRSIREDLESDWGFSVFIETERGNILFDTGGDGDILLANMRAMDIDPESVNDIFISHNHFDHIGGLAGFLTMNSNVNVFVPESFRGVKRAKKVISIDNRPREIYKNIYTTGEIDGIEQSLIIKDSKGLVLFVGCSHPDMKDILKSASLFGRVYAIIGGMHGFNKYELLKDMELICPAHCTQHQREIKEIYQDKVISGGAGRIIEL